MSSLAGLSVPRISTEYNSCLPLHAGNLLATRMESREGRQKYGISSIKLPFS